MAFGGAIPDRSDCPQVAAGAGEPERADSEDPEYEQSQRGKRHYALGKQLPGVVLTRPGRKSQRMVENAAKPKMTLTHHGSLTRSSPNDSRERRITAKEWLYF